MARGNQRELARAKNLKKQQEAQKAQKQGDKNKRMETDAEKMRAKQAAVVEFNTNKYFNWSADARKAAEALAKAQKK
ncbi:4F5 family protein [Candida albicans]|uniref:4F5 family protein n=2 Tax=Candida TaxID=5475 RepID=A0A8H6C1V0_CANAX|nr:4F5 family protein [Candida albicans]KAG8204345.1 hypothetical protein GWM34_00138 [Candida africana]